MTRDRLPLLRLIDVLAEAAAEDYLRAEAAEKQAVAATRTEPAPLPDMDQAA